jgi:hypothetical protein
MENNTDNTPIMNKEDNLRPAWKPGQSGNPNGRPKGSLNRSTIARKWLQAKTKTINPISGEEEIMSQEDIGTLALVKKMRQGDVNAYKALLDSAWGQAKETIDLNQIAEQPLFEDVSKDDSNTEDSESKQKE